ncbi:hypothetical protein C8N46_11349 [Kordia periserrulae]|uniref:Uncharacterized protein n=1 Tax=Kordia periserrulae TaxID=701523 RepID=A0A2T6BR63_9FLAO|nr:hypothetical protein [Kordia periserrulae]PTX58558.1 hypothetical protein C8N46_11349 [Kordia periserrulae]
MKHIFRTFFITIITIFLMPRCQEIDDQTTQIPNKPEFIIKMSNGEHLRASNSYVFKKLQKLAIEEDLSKTQETQSFTLDLENIQIIEKNYYTQYTLLAQHPESNVNLVNYMLLIYDDGTEYQYLIKYPIIDNNDGIVLDYTQATMNQLGGNVILQNKSGIGGTSPCLDGAPQLIDTQEVYTCSYITCSGNEHHEWGDNSCPCMITVFSCSRASQECGWETVNIWSCTGSGTASDGNDYNNAGGSGGDDPDSMPDDEEPVETIPIGDLNIEAECNKIKTFITENENFRVAANNLNNDLDEAYEKALFKVANMNELGAVQGTANDPKIKIPNIPANVIIMAFIHTHYETATTTGQDTYSIFTMEDIESFARLSQNNNINNNFVAFLATGKGTHYALTINDMSKFVDFFYYKLTPSIPSDFVLAQKWLAAKDKYNKLYKKYFEGNTTQITINNTNNEAVLASFLLMLSEADMGINLFKSDSSFQNFTQVSFENTSPNLIKETPCI